MALHDKLLASSNFIHSSGSIQSHHGSIDSTSPQRENESDTVIERNAKLPFWWYIKHQGIFWRAPNANSTPSEKNTDADPIGDSTSEGKSIDAEPMDNSNSRNKIIHSDSTEDFTSQDASTNGDYSSAESIDEPIGADVVKVYCPHPLKGVCSYWRYFEDVRARRSKKDHMKALPGKKLS